MNFASTLLDWYDEHGRKHLPWQNPRSPYRVWISEIMLQQTQVDTVIPYFQRFIERFPDVHTLAQADIDAVLHLWTGLGYYARARNLHRCAQAIVDTHAGELPNDLEALKALPGIGPSTAAAICSLAFNKATAILDGNVKRVLTRLHAIEGWPGKPAVESALWQIAQEHMPKQRCSDYTQAIMDLGATLCTRAKPTCMHCPTQSMCKAFAQGEQTRYPEKKPKKTNPVKHCQMLVIRNTNDEVLLYQRPQTGIWGGLWSLPEIPVEDDPVDYAETTFGPVHKSNTTEHIKHVFSHYTLMIQPVEIWLHDKHTKIMENTGQLWYNPHFPQELGLAAPVKKLLHG